MKKLVSLLLAVCMYLSVSVMLTACDEEHSHTYKTEWAKDTTHHWHACEGEDCTDVADKAEHTWNDGEITTPATKESDGIKTFTCTACRQTKTESVQLKTTVTKAEWDAALAMGNFTMSGFITERDKQETLTMKITENLIYTENDGIERYVAKQSDNWHMTDGKEMGMVMNGVSASVKFALMSFHMPEYESFLYDEQTKSYVYINSGTSGFYQFNVHFENGRIVKIDGCEDMGGVTHSLTFTDYGTTVVELPTVNE